MLETETNIHYATQEYTACQCEYHPCVHHGKATLCGQSREQIFLSDKDLICPNPLVTVSWTEEDFYAHDWLGDEDSRTVTCDACILLYFSESPP